MPRHNKNIKSIVKSSSAIALIAILAGVGGFLHFKNDKSESYLTLNDFTLGTEISYELIADGLVIDEGKNIYNEKGLKLKIPNQQAVSQAKNLGYNLRITPEKSISDVETLDLLINLDREHKNITFEGTGLSDTTNLVLKHNKEIQNIAPDWAGLFSENIENDQGEQGKSVQLAFQNSGVKSDVNPIATGQMEVFFPGYGDNAGNLGQVQSRYSAILAQMAHHLSIVMVVQTEAIGLFFDAGIQLETQRKHQELRARAHKDYHPSEQMCRIGTFIRSVAHAESKSETTKHALNKVLMNQYLATQSSSAAEGPIVHEAARIAQYKNTYCDPRDGGGATEAMCKDALTTSKLEQLNKDIDYTRTLESKLTLDINFNDLGMSGSTPHILTDDEKDLIALAKNLYFPNVFEEPSEPSLVSSLVPLLKQNQIAQAHLDSRSYAAKLNVAHNSFLNIVGMKTAAPEGQARTTTATTPAPPAFSSGSPVQNTPPGGTQGTIVTTRTAPPALAEDTGWAHMKALLREFGMTPIDMNGDGDTTDAVDMTVDEQIDEMLGERPSYYAQMEVLTKKIYQSPDFYTNLYDKPANVERIGVSLDAIAVMNQRDRFDSLLRREMLASVLLEEELAPHAEEVSTLLYESIGQIQRDGGATVVPVP